MILNYFRNSLNKIDKRLYRLSIYGFGESKRLNSSTNLIDLSKIRNIGVIAHVDAGKTTTTERMLYYSGLTENIGDVDKGNTVTDYMDQERERGITITSTPVQFRWNKHVINLIDTPGHVDFNYEVERCLTVLDGSVGNYFYFYYFKIKIETNNLIAFHFSVLLDASAGVEPQTYQVWKQSNNFQIPKLVYLNKMDKPRSNYEKCLDDISKFKTSHLLLQLPVFEKNNRFVGVIDLINLEKNIWNLNEDEYGIVVENKKLSIEDNEYKKALELKEDLIGKLCEFDNELAEKVFTNDDLLSISDHFIINSIRKSTIKNQIVPVLMGSSFKNVGIQLLMNAITRYLPSPLEKNSKISKLVNGQTSGFLFKIKYDKRYGSLFFIRIYEGELKSNAKLINYSKNKEEKVDKIFKVFGNDYTEVKSAKKGDIVALNGLQYSSNGDFFVSSRETFKRIENHVNKYSEELTASENIILNGLKFPEPVIFCSVEAPSPSKELELENALKRLQQEDPSFSVTFNKQTNQTILRGMGDLHLQIIKERIRRDFKLDPYFGSLQIAYLESFNSKIEHELQFDKQVKDIKNSVFLKMILKPLSEDLRSIDAVKDENSKIVKVVVNDENELYKLSLSNLKCIEKGVQLALESGPLLGNKVVNFVAELHDFKRTSKTLDTIIISATYELIKEAFNKSTANFFLLEPIMKMTIEYQDEDKYQLLLRELSNRRAEIGDLKANDGSHTLDVKIPLSETIDLSSTLRSITSGKVHFSMQIANYLPVNKSDEGKIIEESKFGSSLN